MKFPYSILLPHQGSAESDGLRSIRVSGHFLYRNVNSQADGIDGWNSRPQRRDKGCTMDALGPKNVNIP